MRDRLRPSRPEFRLDQMFETHSDAWERVGLAVDVNKKSVQNARRRAVLEIALFIAVIVVFNNYEHWFHLLNSKGEDTHTGLVTAVKIATVLALLALGWAIARDIGRMAGPTFFRRMDPGTAGTVGFLIRLVTVGIVVLVVLGVAGVSAASIVAGSAFTAVILGLAAQQTLGNLFAGMVLLSARPFRVGERVRLQAGAVGGQLEGTVSSLGLLYTTLARGADRIMVPNNVVLSAAVVPLREPEPVNVRVRLGTGIRPSQVQAILDDRIRTPTRRAAEVVLEEIDGDEVVVRVQATPDRPDDGAQLADEVIDALSTVTGEHKIASDEQAPVPEDGNGHQEAGTAASRHWTPGGPEDVTSS
ncbi:MAG TPA: mechanosensitive ion channel family protein [Solirubrobacteraceae bacterium]|nr:mechanosensitive ion channel family protein [Solirubrobacteraceae bacterium]